MMLLWFRAILGQCFKSKLEIFISSSSCLVKESMDSRIGKNGHHFDTKSLLRTSSKLNICYTGLELNHVKNLFSPDKIYFH